MGELAWSSLSEEGFCLGTGQAAQPGLLTHPRPEVAARAPFRKARLGFAPIFSLFAYLVGINFLLRRMFGFEGNIPFVLNKVNDFAVSEEPR